MGSPQAYEIQPASPASIQLPATLLRYGRLINEHRPVHDNDVFSRRHPKMSRLNRAKIFAPFAALDGFDNRVRRKEVEYVPRYELDTDEEWVLNQELYRLHCLTANSRLSRMNQVLVSVEYYALCDDPESDAYLLLGRYMTSTGIVLYVDPTSQCLILDSEKGKEVISFSDIYHISELTA